MYYRDYYEVYFEYSWAYSLVVGHTAMGIRLLTITKYSVVSIIRHVSIISTVWKILQMTLLNVQYDLMLKRSYFLIYVLFTS